jgi:hypothetical protein
VVLNDGEIVSSSTPDLRRISYRRYGEVQQLIIPEEEKVYEIILNGLAIGSFTFEIDNYEGNILENHTSYSAIPSSTSTKVVYAEGEDNLEIDYDGDGVFEAVALPGLSNLSPSETAATADATSTTPNKSISSGTRVKDQSLAQAPIGVLSSGTIELSRIDLMMELIRVLTIYRDLLISVNAR